MMSTPRKLPPHYRAQYSPSHCGDNAPRFGMMLLPNAMSSPEDQSFHQCQLASPITLRMEHWSGNQADLFSIDDRTKKIFHLVSDEDVQKDFMAVMASGSRDAEAQLMKLNEGIVVMEGVLHDSEASVSEQLTSLKEKLACLEGRIAMFARKMDQVRGAKMKIADAKKIKSKAREWVVGFDERPGELSPKVLRVLGRKIDCIVSSDADIAATLFLSSFDNIETCTKEEAYNVLDFLSSRHFKHNNAFSTNIATYKDSGVIPKDFNALNIMYSKRDNKETLQGLIAIYLGKVAPTLFGFQRKNKKNVSPWSTGVVTSGYTLEDAPSSTVIHAADSVSSAVTSVNPSSTRPTTPTTTLAVGSLAATVAPPPTALQQPATFFAGIMDTTCTSSTAGAGFNFGTASFFGAGPGLPAATSKPTGSSSTSGAFNFGTGMASATDNHHHTATKAIATSKKRRADNQDDTSKRSRV